MGFVCGFEFGSFLLELVAEAFREEHAEDVFFVVGCVHFTSEYVACREEETFESREGEFFL